MIKTFQKILDFKRNSVFKLSFKAVRQVNSKFLHPKENNPNNNVKEVSIPEKNLTKVSELNRVEKKKKVKEISTINKFELINKYKINLPLTSYSERLHHGNFEYKYIRKLTTEFYNDQLDLPRDKLWITLDCPPFANGPAHLGTMYNKVLKDITNRFKIIQGYKVNFINGFDCYGVEIEDSAMSMGKSDKIEEIYSKFNRLDQSRKDEDYNHKKMQLEEEKTLEIRKKCRSFVEASLIDHVKNYLRWGIMCNIGQTFLTMDKNYEANQLELFKLLYEKGLIYRDYRVVFWSINDQRIIDDNELGYRQEIKDVLIFKCEIKFFGGETKFLKEKFPEIKLLVYISQPWTYVGIKAIAINPEMNYLIVNMKDEYFICAEKRLPEIARRYNCEKPKKLYQFQGSALLDIIANEPIFNRDLQILADNGVSDKFGSGINALIPAHDFKSEKICAKNKITMRGYVDNQGKFTNDLGIYFKGVDCFTEGGNRIIKKLQKKNSLFLQWDYETTVFFNNKTQETLLLMSIPCFFMKISNKIKLDSLKELAFVKFAPELDFFEEKDETLKYQPQKRRRSLKEKESSTYDNVIEALNDFDDWCISEFNKWGLPIPYFVYIDNENKILLDGEVIDHIAKLIKEEGSDIWFEKSVKDLLPEKYKDQADKLQKGREMFDSFFDSSCSWYNLLIKNTLSLNSSQENSKGPLSDIIKDKFNTLVSDKVSESILEFGSNGKKPHGMIEDKTRTGSITKNEHKHNNNNILEKRQQEHKAEFREQLNEFKIEGFLEGVKAIIPENILLKYGMEKFIKKNYENISYFPADICVEGNDQHKDWLLLSSLTSVALKNEIPFKRIKTHGLINDESGNKMSKTFVKSYLNPLDLTDGTKKLNGERMFGYGADNIRMWIIKNDCDSDIKITEKDIETEKTKLKIFRHFSKFCLGTLSDYDPSFEQKIYTINFEDLEILEQILIHEYIKTLKVIDENLVNYNYRVIYEEIFKFISEKFIKIFMDSTQKLFLTLAKDSYERRSLQYFLKEIFINTLVVLSPIIPFTCEDVYENIDFMVKKPYLGFEEYKNHEYYIRRYSYKIDNNFEFNSSNLTDIKFEMNKIINKMVDMGLNKNEIEIYFETEDTSYEYLLLKSLNNKMSSFFSVAKCVFGVYSKNPEDKLSNRELKKGTIKFEKILNQKTLEKFEIYLNYKIFKTIKNKCIRCLLFKCEAQEVVCEECTKNMKLLI